METQSTQENILTNAIAHSNAVQVDASWAILKYKEIGIYRKVACLSSLFNIDFQTIISQLPQDEEGRILDYKTRQIIHESLISVS
tara:strand:+ start:1572 stop:1826 length:255 start_codon:yes stop_codon:yes gene_type:complete